MGLFDSLQNGIAGAQSAAANASGALPKKTVVFQEMPETLEQLQALPDQNPEQIKSMLTVPFSHASKTLN